MRNAFKINKEQYNSIKNFIIYKYDKIISEHTYCFATKSPYNDHIILLNKDSNLVNKCNVHKFNFLKFLKEFGGYDKLNIDLTGYCVEVENEEESRELQEYAFSKGFYWDFGWNVGAKIVDNLNSRFIYFHENRTISHSNMYYVVSDVCLKLKFKDLLTLHQDVELKKVITEDNLINLGSKNMELEEELIEKIILNSEIEEKLFEISKFKKKLEYEIIELKLKIKERDKPKVGDLCVFSDDDFFTKVVSKFFEINTSDFPYTTSRGLSYKRCVKITGENIINFFKNLK